MQQIVDRITARHAVNNQLLTVEFPEEGHFRRLPRTYGRECVISVRTRRCTRGADGEEEGFRTFVSWARSGADSHRSAVDFATEAGSLPAFRCSIDSLMAAALRHIVPRASKSVNVASSTFATYESEASRRAGDTAVLRGCLGHEDAWKTRGVRYYAHDTYTPTRFYI